ncbi:hypothetical protein [Halostagnicola bangensis]
MIERSLSRSPEEALSGGQRSRRQLLAGGLGVAVAVGTAGCTDTLLGNGDDDTKPVALEDIVPAETELLAELNGDALEADEYDRLLEELDDIEGGAIGIVETLDGLEAETDIDTRSATRVLVFDDESGGESGGKSEAESSDESEDGSSGGPSFLDSTTVTAAVDGDWNTDDVIDSIEARQGTEYEATDFDGNLYEPTGESGSATAPAVGVVGEGQFALGNEAAVRDSLEVRYGDDDPISGQLLEAHDEQDAQFTVVTRADGTLDPDELDAFDIPIPVSFDILEEVTVVSRAYNVVDSGMRLEAGLYTDAESDAEELEEVLRGAIAALRSTSDDELGDALEEVDLERAETVVSIRYEGDEAAVIDLIEEV